MSTPPDPLELALEAALASARATLPRLEHVGIWVRDGESLRTVAASSDVVRELDTLQARLVEGPCVDAVSHDRPVLAPSIRHDRRWPAYTMAAVGTTGLRSQVSVPLPAMGSRVRGSLNLYSLEHAELRGDEARAAWAVTVHATTALARQRETSELQEGLDRRRTIGIALGLVMARHQVDEDGAFAWLVRHSSRQNRKLRDVAADVVARAGTLPAPRSAPR